MRFKLKGSKLSYGFYMRSNIRRQMLSQKRSRDCQKEIKKVQGQILEVKMFKGITWLILQQAVFDSSTQQMCLLWID